MANTLTQTTLSAAITVGQNVFNVASATNLVAPTNGFQQKIYVLDPGTMRGELMQVLAISGTTVTVSRLDQFKGPHLSGALVIINPVDPTFVGFVDFDPIVVPLPPTPPLLTWILNVTSGAQWLWSTVTNSWVPGFNNVQAPLGPTVAVASAAGLITPSGPLFHVTGTSAITGFTLPNGFSGGQFTIIADAVFSWTAANNIVATSAAACVGGVVVVGKAYTFVFDPVTAKFYVLGA